MGQVLNLQLITQRFRKFTDLIEVNSFDRLSPFALISLSIIGVFCIQSAQSYANGTYWLAQLFWLSLGASLYTITSLINYKLFLQYAHIFYALGLIVLLLLWTPLGMRAYGCLRWLNFKIFTIQPTEATKVATLIMASSLLAREKIKTITESASTLLKTSLIFFFPFLLIFLQPDLGSALVFPPMLFALLYVSNLSKKFFIFIFLVFILCLAVVSWDIYGYSRFLQTNHLSAHKNMGAYEGQALLPLKDYQRNRILSFVAPHVIDPKGTETTWNLRQSLIAIGSGGLFGKGHNKGTQAKLGYLPQSVAPNDFIFSVLGEEHGFIGALVVLSLYALLIGNGIRIAGLARDRFGMLLAIGISTILMVHVFVNIGMTIGIMPITGIPLPFLSYGGSFILSSCFLQGIIQSIYRFRKDYT